MSIERVPKVLFVIPGEEQGSSMIFARRQAEMLRTQGLAEVECFHLRSRTALGELYREARRFRAHLKRIQPQIVHAHFGTMTALFAVLLSGSRPVFITYRGSDLNRVPRLNGARARVGRLLSQLAALGATRIVCVSNGLRESLWWRKARATVLPSGVDTSVFKPQSRQEARELLRWGDEPVVLFNAGHDPVNKRLDLAEAAMGALEADHPKARMNVLRGDVLPHQVPVLMNAADCLLVTSDAEGSPTVVQEALATNLPVVSVRVGDIAERLQNISPSVIADRDPAALGRALGGILANGRRSNGRDRAHEFCSERIAEELARLYTEVLGEHAFPHRHSWNTTLFSQRYR